ncbi:hypothetical protein [Halocatena halophila]|uniref:hypothetical protein n=1 Tax=Halocatena halophila TaxID=2814576 RepID=UPI002ED10B2F
MSKRKLTINGIEFDPERFSWDDAWKKPVKVQAVPLMMSFEVETMEGTMEAERGDILIRGVEGELYPCDKNIFSQTYTTDESAVAKYTDGDIISARRELFDHTLRHVSTGVTDTDARAGVRAFIDLLREGNCDRQ